MSQVKKLLITLITLGVAFVLAVTGLVIALVEENKNIETDFKFFYDSQIDVFHIDGLENGDVFDEIKTSVGTQIQEPTTTPIKPNNFFEGWYLDESCTQKAEFPITIELGLKLYPKFLEGTITEDLYAYDGNGYYSISKNMQSYDGEIVVIPDTFNNGDNGTMPVTKITANLFKENTNIKQLYIGDNIEVITTSAFQECTNLESIVFGDSVKKIETNAFAGCKSLKEIKLPETLEVLMLNAFSGCTTLKELIVPKNVYSIDTTSFRGCNNLESIKVDSANEVYDSRNNCNAIIQTISNTLVCGCQNTIIPNDIVRIGPYAFVEQIHLTAIELPDSLKSIGNTAFAATSLVNITIPAAVEKIETSAFAQCKAMTNLTFEGNSLISIGDYTFQSCMALNNLDLPESLQSIGNYAFTHCYEFTTMTIPKNVSSIGLSIFRMCLGLTEINVDSNNSVFDSRDNCNAIIETDTNTLVQGLHTTVIPSSVVAIRDSAFEGSFWTAGGNNDLNIPSSVKSIGKNAFKSCYSLYNLTFEAPNNWQRASNIDFTNNVENVTLSDSLLNARWFAGTRTVSGEVENTDPQYSAYYWKQTS